MAILIIIALFFIASIVFDQKVFPMIYVKTATNPFNLIHKVLCFVFTLTLVGYIPDVNESVSGILAVCIVAQVVLIGVFVLLNLKFKEPKMIALVTALHVVFSVAFAARALLWIVMLALNMGGLALGQDWSLGSGFSLFGKFKVKDLEVIEGSHVAEQINADAQQNAANAAAAQEANVQSQRQAAENVAASYGFSSAEEAEANGVKTGNPQA